MVQEACLYLCLLTTNQCISSTFFSQFSMIFLCLNGRKEALVAMGGMQGWVGRSKNVYKLSCRSFRNKSKDVLKEVL